MAQRVRWHMIGGVGFVRVRCNAHKRVQALPTMPLNGVNTVDAPLQERVKSRKN
jgi:hypothetical protein